MTMTLSILMLLAGILIGGLAGSLLQRDKITKAVANAAILKTQTDNLQARINELLTQTERQLSEQRQLLADRLEEQKALADKQLTEQKAQYESRLNELIARHDNEKTELRTHYEKMLSDMKQQQQEQLEQQSRLIREQITNTTERILKERAAELGTTNKEQLAAILNPLHEKLTQMKEAVEKSDREQTITMERLGQSIEENLKQAREVGQQADRLANALTADNKTQGDFGELKLRQMLEDMGFEEGLQFEEQVMLKENGQPVFNEDGHRMIPDVILHFPDKRDVIIDSKMSIKSYVDYCSAEDDGQRREALARHIQSVRNHVKELSDKKYYEYAVEGHKRLDFVMMYVPNDGALQLALTSDVNLWKDAYRQHVVISDSRSLYMMLSILEMTWRQKRQAENQELIMKTANEIVSRVQTFWERLQKVKDQFRRTGEAFDELAKIAAPNGKSITTSAHKLLKYGASEDPKRKIRLPQRSEEDVDDEA